MTESVARASSYDIFLACGSDLASTLTEFEPHLVSRPSELGRQYAAAGLVRGLDLLGASVAILDANYPDAVGTVVRTIVETWLTSMYLLTCEAEALASLENELNRNNRILMLENDIDLGELLEARDKELLDAARSANILDAVEKFGPLQTIEIARRVDAALPGEQDALGIYNLLFRAYSTHDSHGLAPIARRVCGTDVDQLRLQHPEPTVEPEASIGLATLLMCDLAQRVASKFHLSTEKIETITAQLVAELEATGAAAQEAAPEHIRALLPEPRP